MPRRPPDPRVIESKPEWERRFNLGAREPITWLLVAQSIKRAADIILLDIKKDDEQNRQLKVGDAVKPPLHTIWMLLTGLSLENLLKGIYACHSHDIAVSGRLNKRLGTGHDLIGLLSTVNMQLHGKDKIHLTKEEENLLERAGEFIAWAGRYPVPKDAHDMMPRTLQSGGFAPLNSMQSGDLKTAKMLFNKLTKRLRNDRKRRRMSK